MAAGADANERDEWNQTAPCSALLKQFTHGRPASIAAVLLVAIGNSSELWLVGRLRLSTGLPWRTQQSWLWAQDRLCAGEG